mgnify:CR=1
MSNQGERIATIGEPVSVEAVAQPQLNLIPLAFVVRI